MTFKIGDKVRINNTYPAANSYGEDASYDAVRGSVGTVDRVDSIYVGVVPDVTEHEMWDESWLFLPKELEKL